MYQRIYNQSNKTRNTSYSEQKQLETQLIQINKFLIEMKSIEVNLDTKLEIILKCNQLKDLINTCNNNLVYIEINNKHLIENYLTRNLNFINDKLEDCNQISKIIQNINYNEMNNDEMNNDGMNNKNDIHKDDEINNDDMNNKNGIHKDDIIINSQLESKIEFITTQLEESKKNYLLLNAKINCCLESLANSLELLNDNSKKNDNIYEDLQKNNALTAKISIEQNKSIKIQDVLNNMITNNHQQIENEKKDLKEVLTEILRNKDKLKTLEFKKVEQILEENNDNSEEENNDNLEEKSNDNSEETSKSNNQNIETNDKDKVIQTLLDLILKNSKDVIGKITPQLNLWQRQKIFTTIIKVVDKKIDNFSNLMKKINVDDNNGDINNLISSLIENNDLKISKKDIIDSAWNSDSDSESDDESSSQNSKLYTDSTKNKYELLNNIMDELENNNKVNSENI